MLVVNVGSRTRGSTNGIEGIWEHSLTTRPINFLLSNIVEKEKHLLAHNIIPTVAVCGGGAAGVELAFGYKARWSKLFGQEIKVSVITNKDRVLHGTHPDTVR